MKTFYTLEGDTGENRRYSYEDVKQRVANLMSDRPKTYYILKCTEVVNTPITNLTFTPTEDN